MVRLGKRGVSSNWSVVISILAILVIGFIIYSFAAGSTTKEDEKKGKLAEIFTSADDQEVLKLEDWLSTKNDKGEIIKESELKGVVEFVFKYIFGMHKSTLEDVGTATGKLGELSIRGLMIFISVWIIFFLVFSDMVMTVGFPNDKHIGFLVGLAITIIFANFGLFYWIIIWLMGIFAFAAGLSVVAALVSILVLGVGAHFGAQFALEGIGRKRQIWGTQKGFDKAAQGVKGAKKLAEAASDSSE